MPGGAESTVDRRPTSWTRGEREWTPAFSDWLGDRFLDFDLTTSTSVERLQFRREFGDSSVFESALRERVEELQHVQHPSLEPVRAVVRIPGKGLILESKHTSGRRLSEAIPQERSTAMALDVVRQITPILVALHKAGPAVAHGAIGAERIVVTRDGRLVLAEHSLGSAIAAQLVPAIRWRAMTGLPTDRDIFIPEPRTDLIQLGCLALSILVGHRINPADYPESIERIVGESTHAASGRSAEAAWLRRWVERATLVGPDPFETAQDAYDTLDELSDTGTVLPMSPDRPYRPVPVPAPVPDRPAPVVVDVAPAYHAPPPPAAAPVIASVPAMVPTPVAAARPVPVPAPPGVSAPAAVERVPERPTVVAMPPPPSPRATVDTPSVHIRPARQSRWIVPGLAALAVGEAAIIAVLMISRPDAAPVAIDAPASASATPAPRPVPPPPPTHLSPPPDPATQRPTPSAATPAETRPGAEATADRPATPAAEEKFGGLRVTAAIPLQIFEGTTLVGSTSGPIALGAGPHVIDATNDALGFKFHTTAVVKPGQMTALPIALPNGKLSINAVPWAEVLIDGKSAGQTPLANLAVTIGQHEIIFRHPQYGEQRQTAIVKADEPARVSLTFPREGGLR